MKSLIRAVFTITIFSVIDRALGFFFKIYLSRELGAVSMGIYQVATSVFFVLLTLTTSGIPLIVSKLTAKHAAMGNKKAQNSLTSSALILGVTVAIIVCAAVIIFADFIGSLFATKQSLTILLLLLPAIIFSSIYSAFRGNLWGKQCYKAVSILEIIEQVARIALCVMLFSMGFDKLKMTALSLSIACGISAVACVIFYIRLSGRLGNPKGYILPLLKSSAPITVVRASSSIINSIVAIVVPYLLVLQGQSVTEALYNFGSSIGMAMPLLYIPITVVGSLAFVMIPTLSASVASGNKATVCRQVESAISFSIVIAAIFVPMFFSLGEPIGLFVYNNIDAGKFLSQSAWVLIPLSIENITSSMMNSLELEVHGFFNYCIGSAFMFALLFAFMNNFSMKVLSFGLGVSLTVSSILDIASIKRKTKCSLSFIAPLIKSIALIFPTVYLTQTLYSILTPLHMFFKLSISAGAGIVFMVVLALLFNLIKLDYFKSKKKLPIKTIAN